MRKGRGFIELIFPMRRKKSNAFQMALAPGEFEEAHMLKTTAIMISSGIA
jgi:hypothetical protein